MSAEPVNEFVNNGCWGSFVDALTPSQRSCETIKRVAKVALGTLIAIAGCAIPLLTLLIVMSDITLNESKLLNMWFSLFGSEVN